MRFILRYRYGFFQKKSERIDVSHCVTTDDLLNFIEKRAGRPSNEFLLRTKCDKMAYRLVRGWPLGIYDLKDGSELELEFIERDESESKSKYSNSKYLMNVLGNQKQELNRIEEQEEGDGEESDNSDTPKKKFDVRKYMDAECEKMLKLVQKGKWEAVVKVLEDYPEDEAGEDDFLQLQRLKSRLLNELGEGGWGAIHYAVFCNRQEILAELLKRGVDINRCTTDGWLPLQLAINRKNHEIVRVLLSDSGVRVNESTSKGTPLHIACRLGCTTCIEMLLKAGADWKNLDEKGNNCLTVCSNEQCLTILKNFEEQKDKIEDNNDVKVQQLTILKGTVTRVKAVFSTHSEKYLVLDPYQGILVRYDDESGYPKHPKQTIPLTEITQGSIRIIPQKDKSWSMKKELHYFELFHPKRTLLAVRNEAIAEKWVSGMLAAWQYQSQLEKNRMQAQVIPEDKKVVLELDDKNNKIIPVGVKAGQAKESGAYHNQRPAPITIEKKYVFGVKSPKVSMKESTSECMSPRMPNAGKMSTASRPSERGISSFADERTNDTRNESPSPEAKRSNKDREEDLPNGRRLQTGSSEISLKIREKDIAKEDEKAANKQLTNELNSIISEKVNFASFEVLHTLGSGAFGKVFLARHIKTGVNYALKALKKKTLILKKQLKYAVTEAKVLKAANHPFIINLHYAFQTPNYLYLALDFCPGKDLSFHLARQTSFGEDQTRIYVAELLLAIEHLHNKNILYRDLKPQNILLDAEGHIKLADFGLSKDNVEDKTKSFCGSPAYLSPEMLNQKGVGKESDIYGIGCVLYECLVGEPPYYSDDMPSLFENIRQGKLKYPKHVSDEARSLISGLLERDPKKRLGSKSMDDIKRHPFFSKIDWVKAANRQLVPPVRQYRPDEEDSDEEEAIIKKVHRLLAQANFTDFDYEDDSKRINRLNDFSFVRT